MKKALFNSISASTLLLLYGHIWQEVILSVHNIFFTCLHTGMQPNLKNAYDFKTPRFSEGKTFKDQDLSQDGDHCIIYEKTKTKKEV